MQSADSIASWTVDECFDFLSSPESKQRKLQGAPTKVIKDAVAKRILALKTPSPASISEIDGPYVVEVFNTFASLLHFKISAFNIPTIQLGPGVVEGLPPLEQLERIQTFIASVKSLAAHGCIRQPLDSSLSK